MVTQNKEFQSSWLMQAFIKCLPIIFGLILSGSGIAMIALKLKADSKGEPIPENLKITLVLSGLALGSIFPLIKNKFGVIKACDSEIAITRSGQTSNKNWNDVKRVIKLPFCSPPIYRMSFNDGEKPIYFLFGSFFVLTTPIYSYDFTGFLPYAQKKLYETKIIGLPK